MTLRTQKERRGIALLLVLGVLLVLSATLTIAASQVARRALAAQDARSAVLLSDMREQSEVVIVGWLGQSSRAVVLPSSTRVPAVSVAADTMVIGDVVATVAITAFDQDGMVSLPLLEYGPFAAALPDPAMETQFPRRDHEARPLGLDDIDASGGRSPFPGHLPATRRRFGAEVATMEERTRPAMTADDPNLSAIGAYIATHPADPPRINVSTAPQLLVSAAYRRLGRGGEELIFEARDAGRVPLVASTEGRAAARGRSADPPLVLVDHSTSWSFLITVSLGTRSESWWAVYQASPNGAWRRTQLLVVSH